MTKKTERNLIRIGELSQVSGVRQSTLKYYTEIGILPFVQKEEGLSRWFDKREATTRLRTITGLKKHGFTMEQVVARLNKKS